MRCTTFGALLVLHVGAAPIDIRSNQMMKGDEVDPTLQPVGLDVEFVLERHGGYLGILRPSSMKRSRSYRSDTGPGAKTSLPPWSAHPPRRPPWSTATHRC